MSDIYDSEECALKVGEQLTLRFSYSCNRASGLKEGIFKRELYIKVLSMPKSITTQQFLDVLLNSLLANGFCRMQGKSVKWERLLIKRFNSDQTVVVKKLRGFYGELDKPVLANKGFQFELHSTDRPFPNRCYIRGVPDDFRQFDRKGYESYAAIVNSVEKLFLSILGQDSLQFRLLLAKRVPGSVFDELAEINSAEGVGLLSFSTPGTGKSTSKRVVSKPKYL